MKLIVTTLILIALAINPAATKRNSEKVIAHFELETPATFSLGQNYFLDIDRDGNDDFSFNTASSFANDAMNTAFLVHALGDNEILSWNEYAMISETNDVISSESHDMQWRSGAGEIIKQVNNGNRTQWNGLWSGDRAQYLAVKLHKEDNAYYGWVKVSIDPATETAIIDEYAINRVPSASIMAGQVN